MLFINVKKHKHLKLKEKQKMQKLTNNNNKVIQQSITSRRNKLSKLIDLTLGKKQSFKLCYAKHKITKNSTIKVVPLYFNPKDGTWHRYADFSGTGYSDVEIKSNIFGFAFEDKKYKYFKIKNTTYVRSRFKKTGIKVHLKK